MRCYECGKADYVPGTATETYESDGVTTIIIDVPAHVCPNCSDNYMSANVIKRLDVIRETAMKSGALFSVYRYGGDAPISLEAVAELIAVPHD
ncbi:MAG: type II toxin-antitoxin system MqsA family antitoxin [Candidatus Poribacteria bacterium]|nr:type II toxin-antitoxin system MqsA family antitoxin [Candidatus Poribacteria bacterium]